MKKSQKLVGQYGSIKLLAGRGCPDLAQEISTYLSQKKNGIKGPVPLSKRDIDTFANGNIYVKLDESVRGQDVYIIQTMCQPVNEMLMELLIMLDAVRRDSAGRITAVIPYLAYTRSDKKDKPRTAITARLVADLIETAGADRYMTLDLHAGQIQGFFKIPGDAMTTFGLLTNYVRKNFDLDCLTVTAADLGFAKETRDWGYELGGVPVAFVEKKRMGNTVKAFSLVGDVKGRDVLIVDDEVDTAGSLVEAVAIVKKNGANDVYLAFTHPVFSDPALQRLESMRGTVKKIICTNTLPVASDLMPGYLHVISVAELLGEVIRRAHFGMSVGAMAEELVGKRR